jgi:hypothetical protein
MPGLVPVCQSTSVGGMQDMGVDVVLKDLLLSAFWPNKARLLQGELTFLANNPITACLIIVQGYGR